MPAKPEPAEVHPLANCVPRGDRVVVKRDEKPTQSAGGIHLPDTADRSRNQIGTVVAVGPEVEGLTAGDRVILAPYTGAELNGTRKAEQYAILKDDEILAVLTKWE